VPATLTMEQEFDVLVHFTPTQDQRKALAKTGAAMPDGSFYIRNRSDLSNAISAVGRATPNASESETARRNSVRRHIIKRAKALNLSNMIPDTWNSDGTLKQSDILAEALGMFLSHVGVRGMRWGVHRSRSSRSAAARGKASTHRRGTVSPDAARAQQLKRTVKKSGTQALSNKDLQDLVTRMNLESQHGRLNEQHVNSGKKFITNVLKDVGRQQATSLAAQYGPKGAAWVAKKIAKKAAPAVATAGVGLAARAVLR
jgi:hypothetical protein